MSKDSKQAVGALVAAIEPTSAQNAGQVIHTNSYRPGAAGLQGRRRGRGRLGFLHANAAARCEHVRMNGESCGQPALRGEKMCRFHAEAMSPDMQLPLPEDAASIMLGLTRVLRGLQERRCDIRESMAMLYGLQIAASTLKRLREEMPCADYEEEESPLRELMEHLRDDAMSKQPNRP